MTSVLGGIFGDSGSPIRQQNQNSQDFPQVQTQDFNRDSAVKQMSLRKGSHNDDSVTRINNVADSVDFAERKLNKHLINGSAVTAKQSLLQSPAPRNKRENSLGNNSLLNNSPFNNMKSSTLHENSPRFQRRMTGVLPSFGGFPSSNVRHLRGQKSVQTTLGNEQIS